MFLFLPNQFACFTCLEVFPSGKFSDHNTQKARRVGGKDAHKRFCLQCGLIGRKYTVGQQFRINHIDHVVVRPTWGGYLKKHKIVAQNGSIAIVDSELLRLADREELRIAGLVPESLRGGRVLWYFPYWPTAPGIPYSARFD